MELLIAFLPFFVPAAGLVAALLALRFYLARSAHRERMAAIERGADIRPLLVNATPAFGHRIYLLRGLLWVFGGAALLVALTVMLNGIKGIHGTPGLIGIVPMSVGVAYLVFYRLEERRVRRELSSQISGTFTSRPPSSSEA